jgi:crotonobetainyl-CoA:carnitine CoA-transferase CaiB-like acyl-CoA transferase
MLVEESAGPLTGIVVADFSRVLAGPLATMVLADLGATVIKIEHPRGDETRTWSPPARNGRATYYLSVNRNKRAIALDLAKGEDREIARRIALRADVLVENMRPGQMARWGLDYSSLAEANPRLVYCSISGFGEGRGAALPGYDVAVQAASGFMDLTGEPDGPPTKAGVAIVDVETGLTVVIGVLAALQARTNTGRGQRVRTNLLSVALFGLVNQVGGYLATDTVPRRLGNVHPSLAPYQPLACADGPLVVAVGNDAQFARLLEVLGRPELAVDPRFATNADRVAHREELVCSLEALLAGAPRTTWAARLQEAGVPASPINTVAEGVQLAEQLGLAPRQALPGDLGLETIANPLSFSDAAVTYRLEPPELDEDRDWVLAWLDGSA